MLSVTDCRRTAENDSGAGLIPVLMNLWCYSLLLLWTLFGILVFPFVFGLCRLLLRWPADRLVRWFIWLYGRGWLLLMSPFVQFRREQMGQIEIGKPCLFVVNHLSFFDTYCMALLPVHDVTFALRSWPFRMFWYSGFMRLARYLDVEGSSWEETLSNCQGAFSAGGTVLFFPEGHRSRDGQLQRFYSGGFKAAISTGVPLIPLCIDGTDQLLPPGRKLLRPCRIRLRALESIDTREFAEEDGHIRLRKLVKGRMSEALEDMRSEGPQ
ncbi:MAG: 1-acyl-sn-glycerol-3-phosphate acyltransferase [Desulfuromonadaceae bacterium]|nr:1-acyl-sn-glycerol-3-phosphate acyltransferase [Desulfuromonadaceae bacterium]